MNLLVSVKFSFSQVEETVEENNLFKKKIFYLTLLFEEVQNVNRTVYLLMWKFFVNFNFYFAGKFMENFL